MKSDLRIAAALAALTVAALACAQGSTTAPPADTPLTAALNELSGTVQTLKPEEGLFKDAINGQQIAVKDQVLTHENGRVRIDISNGTIVRVGPLTTFTLESLENRPGGAFALFTLDIGELWIILNGGEVNVDTPSGLASVRGSYLNVVVSPETGETYITCLEGTCTLGNEGGTVTLTAGQTARILNAGTPPETGDMDDQEVQRWLESNPEATLVVVPLTSTSEPATPTPVTPTDTVEPGQPSSTAAPTDTPRIEPSPTPSATDVNCGPPDGWVLYTVKSGETLFRLAEAFQTTVELLQRANCLGTSTVIIAGQSLFVPNVATITPSPTPSATVTPTRTPTKTATPVTPTKTVGPTKTATSTLSPTPITPSPSPTASASPTPDPSTFFNLTSAPADGSTIISCTNLYTVTVTDLDGIVGVFIEYAVNDSTFSTPFPYYVALTYTGNNVWSINTVLDTVTDGVSTASDVVFWRLKAEDGLGNLTKYPASGSLKFTDPFDCAGF
ncbi:MAG: LysM peptidoglycan-binding domain-containing protein [Chloroflexi bacterium]|nr:LysM peptidoglycan-binding domain-containing protein [Chloroflexota bacterium]